MYRYLPASLIFALLFIFTGNAHAQIEYSPAFPKLTDQVTFTIDLTKATGAKVPALLGLTSGVYLWSGANTSTNGNYNYTPAGQSSFNQPYEPGKMTYLGNSKWQITLTPKAYYRVPDGVTIKQLIFVLRNAAGTAQTETFYVQLGLTPYKVLPLPAGLKDGVNYINDNTVILSLLAPKKKYVHVLGDINNWQINPAHIMNRTPDGERYWLKITGLTPGKEYMFQYLVDGVIRTADPYSDKVIDPWTDMDIPASTYPNLLSFPEGKTTFPVSVMQTGQKPYNWQVQSFVPPPKNKMIVYELCVRDFSAKHNYKTVMDSLNYLEKLGVNVIELMPVTDFDGNLNWGYITNFYFAPDKYFGTKNELKALIDECHKRGIAVVLDMVLNHSWGQNPLARMYWNATTLEPSAESPWYNSKSNFFNPLAHFGPDFNHESPYTQKFVDSVNAYWLTEYKVDGFRFDFTKGFTNQYKPESDLWGDLYDASRIAILKRMTTALWKVKPNAYAILEHLCFSNQEEKELANHGIMMWGNFSYHFGKLAKGESVDISWMNYKQRGWTQPNLVSYWDSHDWQRPLVEAMLNGRSNTEYNTKLLATALERMKLSSAFLFPIPGPKMLWMFDELGYDVDKDFNGFGGPKPIRWEYLQDTSRLKLYKAMSAIISLKKNYLAEADVATFTTDAITKSMHITNTGLNVTIIGNYDIVTKTVNPKFQHTGLWYDYFTGSPILVNGTDDLYSLTAGEFHIFTDKPVAFPEKGLVPFKVNAIKTTIESNPQKYGINVYPNPGTGRFNLTLDPKAPGSGSGTATVYNFMGRKVNSTLSVIGDKHFMVDITSQPSGQYVLNLQSGGQYINIRLIKQ
ncbi:MAG: T9SS type A sorting domain-containing protein [Sphingobacteriales bacterium]|nr:MAG: T9SS type A sorting domain-containing protein [Sphingobacteriales bacterium]